MKRRNLILAALAAPFAFLFPSLFKRRDSGKIGYIKEPELRLPDTLIRGLSAKPDTRSATDAPGHHIVFRWRDEGRGAEFFGRASRWPTGTVMECEFANGDESYIAKVVGDDAEGDPKRWERVK